MKSIIIFLCVAYSVFSQAPASLQSEVNRLYTASHDIDITALSEMLCTSDPDAYAKLDSHFQNDDQKFRYVFTNAKYNYSPPKIIDGKTYFVINFRNVVRVTYFNPIDAAAMQLALKEKFAAQAITYDKARNAFMITYTARMIAIQDQGWKFAFVDATMPEIETCVSDSVRKELGL